MIPKIIHQIWIGPLPPPQRLLDTWRNAHPSWEYRLWTSELDWENQSQIDLMPEWNGKADIMRYEILEAHGGVYIDADAECVRPLPDSFLAHDSFACFEHEVLMPGLIATGYVGASKNNVLMRRCIDGIKTQSMSIRAWMCVGPLFFTAMADDYEGLHIYPSRVFIPVHHTGTLAPPSDEPIIARQHWGSTHGYASLYDLNFVPPDQDVQPQKAGSMSSINKWDSMYAGVTERQPYGDSTTYQKGAAFLGILPVEDWGCGLGWYRNFAQGPYIGLDGSHSKHADAIVDLGTYRSPTDAIFMRHVLEHNHDWRPILKNALASFTKKMVLVLFTPFGDETRVLTEPEYAPGVKIPDISFARKDIVSEIESAGGITMNEETIRTGTCYGVEHVFYLSKEVGS